eukprot:CAMPEP_0117758514 /NCGR_PEP_ID=MMETSP0947-20121206/15428_1 /TAXON_ID=44440 /ORGANISM="Chattonella subsalsa, Strain CCMP2191" /LENGTH=307 /DNA_ID=CAMNT_0005578725 /DNA_START=87 /DNA_END=1010 /DNA_ORIENTATION=+
MSQPQVMPARSVQTNIQGHGTLQQQPPYQQPVMPGQGTLQQQQQPVAYQQPIQQAQPVYPAQPQQQGGGPQYGIPMAQQPARQVMQSQKSLTLDSTDELDQILGPFPCVKVRGLPFECQMQDIVMFFEGLVIVDICLPKRADGRVTGEGFVVFANPMDTQMALQRDRQNMGHRYLEISQATRKEYYWGVGTTSGGGYMDSRTAHFTGASPASSLTEHTGYLRLRGLPFSANRRDIIDFLDGYNFIEDSIEFIRRPDGRMTGECYIKFSTIDDAKKAMEKDRSLMGSRYVELFISAVDEYTRATGKPA